MQPRVIIAIGFVMVVLGFVIPFLMLLQVIPSNFFLAFLSYVVSTAGLFLGVVGVAMQRPRHKD